jgi:acyl dehydratase
MSLTLRCTLLDKRISKSRPEMGLARMRCELLDENGAPLERAGLSPGYRNLRWIKPVAAGDTLAYATEVTEKRELATRPEWGLVFSHITAVNQRGEIVFEFQGSAFYPRRGA